MSTLLSRVSHVPSGTGLWHGSDTSIAAHVPGGAGSTTGLPAHTWSLVKSGTYVALVTGVTVMVTLSVVASAFEPVVARAGRSTNNSGHGSSVYGATAL